jgi:transcription initiation factor TFIIE subunit alpha
VAPTAVRGDANTATQLEVQLTSASEKSAAELIAEQARKAAVAAQNQLPVWHTNSTVTGEETALGRREAVAAQERQAANGFLGLKKEEEEKKAVGNGKEEDALAQYYAELAREKEKEEREEREDDETSGEDDDDDFEDVGGVGTGSAGIGTPGAVPTPISAKLVSGTAMARLRSQDSESGSSPATETTTPAFIQGMADEDITSSAPAAKKPRLEEPKPQQPEEDSEEEEEFEDVNT